MRWSTAKRRQNAHNRVVNDQPTRSGDLEVHDQREDALDGKRFANDDQFGRKRVVVRVGQTFAAA